MSNASIVNTQITCTDLSKVLGYPIQVNCNSLSHNEPLFWHSFGNGELIDSSDFLESLGLPLADFLPKHEIESIPSEIQAIAAAVPGKQFQLLQAIYSSKEAKELATSSPLLFVLLVDYAERHNMSVNAFKRLVKAKRQVILEYMGLVSTNSALRLLAKTPLKLTRYSDLQKVFDVLRDESLLLHFRHVPNPCIPTFLLIWNNNSVLWPGLLMMLDKNSGFAEIETVSRLANDTYTLGARLPRLKRITTINELQSLHDKLVAELNAKSSRELAEHYHKIYGAYPEPPIPGNAYIQPLIDWRSLVLEGKQMHHCVGSYHSAIANGQKFIYQVIADKRYTLSLSKTNRGWVVDQMRGTANCQPSEEAYNIVGDWMVKHHNNQSMKHSINEKRLFKPTTK